MHDNAIKGKSSRYFHFPLSVEHERGFVMKKVLHIIAAVSLAMATTCATAADRPLPEWLKRATVYQMVLRNFTRNGNFKAATAMLDHVRATGVDVVYLTPFVEMDRDMDEAGWSPSQKRSGFNSPKNPYRVADYNKVDPEYGTFDDWKAFSAKAHALGMKVFLDLVYVHCGPNNVLKDLYPDAFQRNEDGSVKMTRWRFPYVNFDSKPTRKYLIDSMLFWMESGADGFRCDSGDMVPVEFWEEAAATCRKINPELVLINEGNQPKAVEKAFDANYGWPWSVGIRGFLNPVVGVQKYVKGKSLRAIMDNARQYEARLSANSLMLVMMDNHDLASLKTDGPNRFDRILPVEAGNAAFVLMFLRRGLPMLYNGNEIADNAPTSFFAPVEHTARVWMSIDWGRALQPAGQKRLDLIRRLAKLHHDDPVFYDGTHEWLKDGEKVNCVSFVRQHGNRAMFVAANLRPTPATFVPGCVSLDPQKKPILAENFKMDSGGKVHLGPYGFVVVALK